MTDQLQLESELNSYSDWRNQLSQSVQALSVFLKESTVTDLRTQHQFELVLDALADDNLSLAFVAEYSRGKSEMINTIFFGEYQQRMLPSGSGRTTMCPTELLYDANRPTSLRLLPIETRSDERPMHALKDDPDAWKEVLFDADDADSIAQALTGMTASKLVSKDYALNLGFNLLTDDNSSEIGLPLNEYDEVEIPNWRHAIINMPHPLLEKGLVILDTPGLNAVGSEPELTMDQLGSAHAVVFILSTDTGVTQTDRALWEHHLDNKPALSKAKQNTSDLNKARRSLRHNQRRLIALNKIDTLWDGIRSEEDIKSELDHQIELTAKTLNVDPEYIYPVSAQKGLLGRLQGDEDLIKRSRIRDLEAAIADRLVPQKQHIVVDKVRHSLEEILDNAGSIIDNRLNDVRSHIDELAQLSSKNVDVISHMMAKVTNEKASLEQDMTRYQALRSVYSKEATRLAEILSPDRLERLILATKHNMSRCASSITLQKTITKYFEKLHQYLDQASKQAAEIASLSENITRDFEYEHGIENFRAKRLQLENFKQEVERLEQKYSHLKGTKTLFFREQMSITNRFYDSVCQATRKIFSRALEDANNWNNNLMVPVETHVRENHSQLRRRLESVKRIHKATDTVDLRLAELEAQRKELQGQQDQFNELQYQLAQNMMVDAKDSESDDERKYGTDSEDSGNILYWEHSINF